MCFAFFLCFQQLKSFSVFNNLRENMVSLNHLLVNCKCSWLTTILFQILVRNGRTDSESGKNSLVFHCKCWLMTQKQWRLNAKRSDGITTSLQPTTGVNFRGTLYKLWQEERYRAIYKAIVLQRIPQVGPFLPFCPVYMLFINPGTVVKW